MAFAINSQSRVLVLSSEMMANEPTGDIIILNNVLEGFSATNENDGNDHAVLTSAGYRRTYGLDNIAYDLELLAADNADGIAQLKAWKRARILPFIFDVANGGIDGVNEGVDLTAGTLITGAVYEFGKVRIDSNNRTSNVTDNDHYVVTLTMDGNISVEITKA